MLKFNNDHIFTGYLKQLLASFNLPKYRVYTKAHRQYKDMYGVESPEIIETIPISSTNYQHSIRHIPYIKDNNIAEYVYTDSTAPDTEGAVEWRTVGNYYMNKPTPNYTKTLKIKNNIYDSYTHEYLGDFLRFIRDYFELNLMPLYNCFSNRICNNLLIDCSHQTSEHGSLQHFIFDSQDKNYKIYMLPVKLFKEYTIAIDCSTKVEICCGLFNSYYDETNSEFLAHTTYKQYNNIAFNQPVLYTGLKDVASLLSKENIVGLANREHDLKLFIKLPVSANTSITILEGNYLGYNDVWTKRDSLGRLVRNQNHTITNFEDTSTGPKLSKDVKILSAIDFAERTFTPITPLQLLATNTTVSYPFADKLIEYLSGNVITSLEELPDNIKRVQTIIEANTQNKITGEAGFWDERFRPILYNHAQKAKNKKDFEYEVFGYVDKEIEQTYAARLFNKFTSQYENTSIANVDIYPDIYLAMKQTEKESTTVSPAATPWARSEIK